MKIKYKLSIGYPGAVREDVIEIDDEDLEGLTSEKIERIIDDIVLGEALDKYISISWGEIK